MIFLELSGFVLSVLGNIFIIYKKWYGFLVWIMANIIWISFNLFYNHYLQALLYMFYTTMCIWGIYQWRKSKE